MDSFVVHHQYVAVCACFLCLIVSLYANKSRATKKEFLSRFEKFWVFLKIFRTSFFFFSKNIQKCFAYNSATKYHLEAVLYSKRTVGYPLSPHIKTIDVAFFRAA